MITDLTKWDAVKQSLCPTLMVPQKSELPECKSGQTRFLMAADGLYLETRTEWGGLVRKLWDCPRLIPLPYGKVEEKDDFIVVLHDKVMPIVSGVMIPEAAKYAEQGKEWAGFVVWNGSDFVPWTEEFNATASAVDFLSQGAANLPEGLSLVADIHSHWKGSPFFSKDDNASDNGRIKIAVVLGNYRVKDNKPVFDWKARYCVEGFFFSGATAEDSLIEKFRDLLLRNLGEEVSRAKEDFPFREV